MPSRSSACTTSSTGAAWLYTAGQNQPPGTNQTFQPWARSTYIGQKGVVAPGERVFQSQPSPYDQPFDRATGLGCDPLVPATPHADAMMVLLLDASVRRVSRSIDREIWNRACLPNDVPPGIGWD